MNDLRLILDTDRQHPLVNANFSFGTHPTVLLHGTAIRFIQELFGHGSAKTTAHNTVYEPLGCSLGRESVVAI
jgi:hypothetical protein